MVDRDGNGWTSCSQGHRHWGRYGAAGLLAYVPADGGVARVMLQRRSRWGNYGGTWGPPGGARDSHESAVAAALREAAEECDLPADSLTLHGIFVDDHGGWSFQTVIARAPRPIPVRPLSSETSQASWVAAGEVAGLDLHPGFAARWPALREALQPLTIIVDAANVMGSRPDGWWRDRAGAARRLRDQLAGLAAAGVSDLPESMPAPGLERWYPEIVLVVEGAARPLAAAHAAERGRESGRSGGGPGRSGGGPGRSGGGPGRSGGGPGRSGGGPGRSGGEPGREPAHGGELAHGAQGPAAGLVRVVAAAGSGDDTIAALARDMAGRRLVVTADRKLRERCIAAGAMVTGPGWLLRLL